MVNMGNDEVRVLGDGWTQVAADKRPSAHFEHTVALTADGPLLQEAVTSSVASSGADTCTVVPGASRYSLNCATVSSGAITVKR